MENEVKETVPGYYTSPQDYLKAERSIEYRNEYYYGEVSAVPGSNLEHAIINSNIIASVGRFLKHQNCRVLSSNMRVSTPYNESYMYPDASIYCGAPQLESSRFDTLLNPSVIFEILSPASKGIDKGRKFFFYQQIPSLREYIMIDSAKKHIQVARKQPENSWKFEETTANDTALYIETINYHLLLSEIYDGTAL